MISNTSKIYDVVDRHLSILVGDKDDFIREKIAGIISREKNVRMVTQISDCANIKEILDRAQPDIVLLGAECIDGEKEGIRNIVRLYPNTVHLSAKPPRPKSHP